MLAGIIILTVLRPSAAATVKFMSQPRAADVAPVAVAAAVTQPRAGDLVSQVKDQLAGDHEELGKVSAALMSVQSQVDTTEQSMLGKVLDLQTARTFFERHEEIDTANQKKTDDISKLNTQVEGLSSTLNKVQKEFLSNGKKNLASEGKLHTEIVEAEALMTNMNAELSKKDDVQVELKKLTAIHKHLMEESVNVTEIAATSESALKSQRASASAEVRKHKSLREQLLKMNNYSMACHDKVAAKSKKLGMAMTSASKDNQAAVVTLRQRKRALDATEQRLLAERALLVTETKKMEADEVQEVAKLRDLRDDLHTLEGNIVAEVRAMQAKIKAEKDRVKTLSVDLMENSQAEMEHNAKKEAMENQLIELTNKIRNDENPILIATTEAQNDALQAELKEAYKLWKSAKTSETAAVLNVEQANATAAATNEGLKLADSAVATARTEGRKKVAEAIMTASKSKAKSQVSLDKAQSAVAARCKGQWDAIWKKKRSKLVKCKALKDELTMEEAKKETLTQTLKARVASE